MRISVGIPVYDGKLQMQTVTALLTEVRLASESGDTITPRFLPYCTNLALGRNHLVKEFLASNDDRLVFVDGDISFEPGSLLKIAKYPVDFVGGAYRVKEMTEFYPVGWMPGDLWSDKNGLLEVTMVPTGFLSLSRDVFKQFRAHYCNREINRRGYESYGYFQIPYKDGQLYTEDAYFCREWREMGGKIYLDPNLDLTHWQNHQPYLGNIGRWLKRQALENHTQKEV